MIQPALALTLVTVAQTMAEAADDWWIIGSAAVALHGADPGPIGDVDILVSERDAVTLIARHGMPRQETPSDRFRSAQFARWATPALPVELMAKFEVATPTGWQLVRPQSRIAIRHRGTTLFVPSRAHLIQLFALFDRPKDRARAQALRDPSAL